MGDDRQRVTCELLKTAVMNDNSSLPITRHLLSQHKGSWTCACADTPQPWQCRLWATLQVMFLALWQNDTQSLSSAHARARLSPLYSLNLRSSVLLCFPSFPLFPFLLSPLHPWFLSLSSFRFVFCYFPFLHVPARAHTLAHLLAYAHTLPLNIPRLINSQMFKG